MIGYRKVSAPAARSSGARRARLSGLIAAALLMLGLALGCSQTADWTEYRGPGGAGYTPNALYPPFGRRWKFLLQRKAEAAKSFNPPLVKGDTIYFGSHDNNFYAFDVVSGYQRWHYKTLGPVNSVPSVDEENVYFGSNDGSVYALNRETGRKLWSFPTGQTVQSLVLRYKNRIIFTSDLGKMFLLSPDGKLERTVPNPFWMHHAFQVRDDILYWAPKGMNFAAYDIEAGRYLDWEEKVTTGGVWYSFPAIDERHVYYGRSQLVREGPPRLLFKARTRKTGETVWEQQALFRPGDNMPLSQKMAFLRYADLLDYLAPSLWKDLVIFTAGDTVIRAFYSESGKPAWKRTFDYPVSSAPTIAGDRIYVGLRGDEDGDGQPIKGNRPKLLCLAADSGRVLWELELDGVILSAPVVSGKRLMFGTNDFHFHVLEEVF